jgi:hypothetical protein
MFSYLGIGLQDLWTVARNYLGTKWAVVILVVGIVYLILNHAATIGVTLAGIVAGMLFTQFNLAPDAALFNVLALTNTILPLAEAAVLSIAYAALLGVMTLYRHIKSMIMAPIPGGGGT